MKKKIITVAIAFILSVLFTFILKNYRDYNKSFMELFWSTLAIITIGLFIGYKDKDENKKDVTKK
jgi:hypothetical protein